MNIIQYLKQSVLLPSFLVCTIGFANNLHIQNIQVASVNVIEEYAMIQFDVSWENSWRDTSNWDAVWVYRQVGDTEAWQHATLNLGGHTIPFGFAIDTSNDGKGIFIYRNAKGSENVNFELLELRWNFGLDGVAFSDNLEISVF